MIELIGMDLAELEKMSKDQGQPSFRGKQLFSWLYDKRVSSFDEMTNLPKRWREELKEKAKISYPQVVSRQVNSMDGTTKYLLELTDGNTIEAVLLRYRHGNSVCISTQVGCQMGCRFCASTIGGLQRNLTASEMLAQLLAIYRDWPTEEEEKRISHVVLMGIGEPLENYEEVMKFLRLVHEPAGFNISYRNITLSTSGLIWGIRKLMKEELPITLAVSLHAPNDALRSTLMPINKKNPLKQLIPVCNEYGESTGRRVTYEYILIDRVNDRVEHARELANLLRGSLAHVNLIPLNPVEERDFNPSKPEAVTKFRDILSERGISVTVRRELGKEIDAACGQLRRSREKL